MDDDYFVRFAFGNRWRGEDMDCNFSTSQSMLALLREQRITAHERTVDWHRAVQHALYYANRLTLDTLPASIIFEADTKIQHFRFECMKVIQDGLPRHDDIRELMCPDMHLNDETRSLLYPWTTLAARKALQQYDNAMRRLCQAVMRWFEIYNQLIRSLQTICRLDAFFFVQEKLISDRERLACELDYENWISAFLRYRLVAALGNT